MNTLITSDIHMTNNPRDADRWNLWTWLREQVKKHDVSKVLILGDLTEEKDKHPSSLVNRFVREASDLAKSAQVILIKGNHDGIDENHPFFQFLNKIPGITFITKPRVIEKWLFLPHTKKWEEEWDEYLKHLNQWSHIFCHHTFEGAIAENGQTLRGISPTIFKGFKGKVYSGDIHAPQRVGAINYIGSPYRIHFGDNFQARVMLLQNEREKDLHFPGKGRELCNIRNLRDLQENSYILGTQIKVRVSLKRSEYPEWANLRKSIIKLSANKGWELCGIELEKIQAQESVDHTDTKLKDLSDHVRAHSKAKKLPKDLSNLGLEILKEVQDV